MTKTFIVRPELMAAEVAHVGEDHRNAVFIGSGNDFIITDS